MASLTSALDWYHKKIGAYDKELWEKSVDRRILRGVCAIPKKSTRIKTELIDVDLVRGSAFAKAKPQHSWISATIAGMRRVFLLPFYFSWWKVQTNFLVSSVLVFLYILQIGALFLYFSFDEKELSDVPILEILTPAAMLIILGIILSQIVATFTSKKSRKHLTGDKRHGSRVKSKRVRKSSNYERESKSSPESASDSRTGNLKSSQTRVHVDKITKKSLKTSNSLKAGRNLRFSFEDKEKVESSNEESGVIDSDSALATEEGTASVASFQMKKLRNFSEESQFSHISADSAFQDSINQPTCNDLTLTDALKKSNSLSEVKVPGAQNSKCTNFSTIHNIKDVNVSSDDDLFVTRRSSLVSEQLKNCSPIKKNICSSDKLDLSSQQKPCRRYSDGSPSMGHANSLDSFLPYQNCLSADNILTRRNVTLKKQDSPSTCREIGLESSKCSYGCFSKDKMERRKMNRPVKFPMNIQNYSSSCESAADTTSPNTPNQPQPSDLDWPLITNTDCNSDSTDSASNCSSDNSSDISPSENPFAWEIQEPSKKLPNVGYAGMDKGYRPRAGD